jgi:hypothetical protein
MDVRRKSPSAKAVLADAAVAVAAQSDFGRRVIKEKKLSAADEAQKDITIHYFLIHTSNRFSFRF